MRREIADDGQYFDQLRALGDVARLDERLRGLHWALWLDAEDFPVVEGFKTLRVARLHGYGAIPTLMVLFNIERTEKVILRWIEIVEEEEIPEGGDSGA